MKCGLFQKIEFLNLNLSEKNLITNNQKPLKLISIQRSKGMLITNYFLCGLKVKREISLILKCLG